MDANPKLLSLLAAVLLAALARPCVADEEPPLPFPMQGDPQTIEGQLEPKQPLELAQPTPLRGEEVSDRVRGAFDLNPSVAAGPKSKADADAVRLASASEDSPRGQELLALYAAAQRAAGRGRSVSDLTDLIEQCEQTAEKLKEPTARDALDRLTSWVYNQRGQRLTVAGQPHDAFADFQHAIVLDDQNHSALDNRGVTLALHDRPQEALADFNAAVALRPTNAAYRRNRAELLADLGKWQAALRDYAAAFKHGIADASLYSGSGYCQARLGRHDQALRDYNQAIKIAPNDPQALALRGALFAEAGHYEQATADLNAALAADPASHIAYKSVAWLLATCPDDRFRDDQKALEAARRAQHFGPVDDPLLLDVLAAAHANAGELDDAVRVQQQATMLAPVGLKKDLERRLNLYRAGRAYREPTRRVAVSPASVQAQR